MLLFLILLTSVCGMAATWFLTGIFYDGGLPHTSLLVALGIALAWGIAYERLEQRYLAGEFDRVRRMLALWSSSMGKGEALLLRVWMAVEAQREDLLQNDLADARSMGLHAFAQAWSGARMARLGGSPEESLKRLTEGLKGSHGVNRAEILLEILFLRLQRATIGSEADLRFVNEQGPLLLREVDEILQDTDLGVGGRSRLRYLSTFHQLLRGMLWGVQGERERAVRKLTEVSRGVRQLASMRGRRLGWVARVERLLLIRALKGEDEYSREFTQLAVKMHLPGLRLRLSEVEAFVTADRERAQVEEDTAREEQMKRDADETPEEMSIIEVPHLPALELPLEEEAGEETNEAAPISNEEEKGRKEKEKKGERLSASDVSLNFLDELTLEDEKQP